MSRWIEQFEAHPFQAIWLELKESVDEAEVDDETQTTSVTELARVRKATTYLDGIINGIDPELVPLSTWDNFNTQAAACLKQTQAYNSNRNIGHLTQANVHIDNLLSYVRPYMVVGGKLADALQRSIKSYAKTIDEYGERFRNNSSELVGEIRSYKDESRLLHESIDATNKSIKEMGLALFGENDDEGIDGKIKGLVIDFENKYENINELYNETLIGDEDQLSTKKSIEQAKEAISGERKNIQALLIRVNDEVNDLDAFHLRIFGQQNEKGEREGGLADDFSTLKEKLVDFETKQKDKYMALNEQIEGLLPGATSAGLAKAYQDMRGTFDTPIKTASSIFYGSIILLILASFILTIDSIGGESWITFVQFNDWEQVLKGLANKVPFYIPILWLAFYASKRRSEYQRLQQEYAHKEALSKSYNNYKKQLEELGGEDRSMQEKFIMKAIDAIAYNASDTLDKKHGDKMPSQEVIEKIIQAALAKLGK